MRETTLDLDTEPPCFITLWHDQASVYNPGVEWKPYILTVSMGGENGCDAIREEDIDEFKVVVAK